MKSFYQNYAFLSFVLLLLFSSCKSWVHYEGNRKWAKRIAKSEVFKKGSTGFALYDLEKKKLISQYRGDQGFTPASNTKLFTVFAGLETFGNEIPVIQYQVERDTLHLYPIGFPGIHYVNESGMRTLDSLAAHYDLPIQMHLADDNLAPYGPGWAWDDSGYIWQAPRTTFPIYGNSLRRLPDSTFISLDSIAVSAPNFEVALNAQIEKQINPKTRLFPFYPDSLYLKNSLKFSQELQIIVEGEQKPNASLESIYVDAIPFYKGILEDSDNFLSEQLLIMASKIQGNTWNIDSLISSYNSRLDRGKYFRWVDGSGLSRYNSFSPLQIVFLLEKMIQNHKEELILEILPEGAKEGTIRRHYSSLPPGTLYAKTGSLTGVHCLSGILKTRKGKTMAFSFMHNQIPGGNITWKKEMEKVLLEIHSSY
ncbi:MAG: hypothetical protein HKN16_11465 [Saprospiraceae bacterium]|nr:hypothetical protein [Saprospiraceae bacterium]